MSELPSKENQEREGREPSREEIEDGVSLSLLIDAIPAAEAALFTFFEAIDEDSKPYVYEHAMRILSASRQFVLEPPRMLQ